MTATTAMTGSLSLPMRILWFTHRPGVHHTRSNVLIPSSKSRARDITSMFVNIYGSKELFIAEYETVMSERLLSALSYDADREVG